MVVNKVASFSDDITPFLIDRANVRGRMARLGGVAHTILGRYDYPPPVARVLGELLLVAAMLSSNLKQDGIFTLQIKSKGLVPLLVVDAEYGGALRGYAELPPPSLAPLAALPSEATLQQVFGEDAYLAITLDPGAGMQRYQGVVAIEVASIVELVSHYFTQSQQLDVMFTLAVAHAPLPASTQPVWMAGGMMIERLPSESAPSLSAEAQEEGWRYSAAILGTLRHDELVDPMVDAPTLLHRLFHEEGVWLYPAQPVIARCRCSRERILTLLISMPLEDRAEMLKTGAAKVHCQFCNTTEQFTPADLGLSIV